MSILDAGVEPVSSTSELPIPGASASAERLTHSDLAAQFAAELDAEDSTPALAPKRVTPANTAPSATSATDEPLAPDAIEADPASPDEGADADADATETAPPSIQAPAGMSEADRALFAQLTPEAQAWVTQRETQRTADYTRKTQEVAATTKAVTAERQQLAAQLSQANNFLSQFTAQPLQPPNPALQHTDPIGYQEAMSDFVQAKHRQEQAIQAQSQVQFQQQQLEASEYGQFVESESQKLVTMMPEFADPKSGPPLRKAVVEYAREQGFGQALPNATAAEVSVLVKAMRYDQAQIAKSTVPVIQALAPRSVRPGPARAPGRNGGMSNAVQTLNSSPSRQSLAAAYAAELASER